jgi:holin-like protein
MNQGPSRRRATLMLKHTKKIVSMIAFFAILLGFDLLGEFLERTIALPIPGPLIGMILLALVLLMRPQATNEGGRKAAHLLTSNLSLFFVPAGVGVMTQIPKMLSEWLPISVALVVSTLTSLLVAALVMQSFTGRQRRQSAGSLDGVR